MDYSKAPLNDGEVNSLPAKSRIAFVGLPSPLRPRRMFASPNNDNEWAIGGHQVPFEDEEASIPARHCMVLALEYEVVAALPSFNDMCVKLPGGPCVSVHGVGVNIMRRDLLPFHGIALRLSKVPNANHSSPSTTVLFQGSHLNATSEPLRPRLVSMKSKENRMPSLAPFHCHSLPQPKSDERKKGWHTILANLFPAGNSSCQSALLRACLDVLGDADD